MPAFQRLWPFLERVFPPYGRGGTLVPQEVTADVSLTHEIFRADVGNLIYLRTANISDAGAGAGITQRAFASPIDRNMVVLPVWFAISHTGLAQQSEFTVRMDRVAAVSAGSGTYPTTEWPDLFELITRNIQNDRWVPLMLPPPIPFGNEVNLIWSVAAVGQTVRTHALGVEVPASTFDWSAYSAPPGTTIPLV